MSQARDNSKGNRHRLPDQKGEKGGSYSYSASHEPANGEDDYLNSHPDSANANTGFVVNSRHGAITWPWT
jgi:hypothetical protein